MALLLIATDSALWLANHSLDGFSKGLGRGKRLSLYGVCDYRLSSHSMSMGSLELCFIVRPTIKWVA